MLYFVWEVIKRGENIFVWYIVIIFVCNSLCRMLLGIVYLDIENISLEFNKEILIILLDEVFVVVGEMMFIDLMFGLNWLDFYGWE